MLEGYLDVLIRYRGSILALMRDASSTPQGFYEHMLLFGEHANELITGPDAGPDEKVRTPQALAALGDPLIMFPNVQSKELRQIILNGPWRLLNGPINSRKGKRRKDLEEWPPNIAATE